MGKTKLEEGEACYNADGNRNIDIDVALSYFDERIQDVLGHYQKDFDGGVSVENLGARFGGYGSFLPAYQRSPFIWSHPRTPQKVQNDSTPRSPHNQRREVVHQNTTAVSSETRALSPRLASSVAEQVVHQNTTTVSSETRALSPRLASSSAPPLPASRTSSVDRLAKFQNSKECVPKDEPVNLPINQFDQKTLKVRIKVGSEGLLAQKNAAIYSGLGLDMSPSSSPEDSPAEWKGNFPEYQDTLCESPSCIVKIMTSFPIPDGALVTPLHDSFVLFVEERFLLDENRSRPAQESFSILQKEVAPRKGSREVFGEKKIKVGDNIGRLEELKNEIYKDPLTAVYPCLKKEMNSETSAGKEILSNTLKLPLTSLKKGKVSGIAEGTGKASDSSEANNGVAMDRIVSFNLGKEETLKSIFSQEASMIDNDDKQNAKTSLVEKVRNDKKVGRDLKKYGGTKGDNRNDLAKEDCDIPKGLKGLNGGTIDPSRQKLNQRVTSYLQDGLEVRHAKEQASFRGEKKSKGNQSNGSSAPELSKESLKVGSSAVPKDNITHDSCFPSKSKGDDMKTHKDLQKGKGIHGKNEIRKYLLENPVKDCMKDFKLEVSEKEIHALSNKSNKRSGGKKADFLSASEARVKGDLDGITLAGKGCNSDALPLEVAPVVIKENWVYCDKCHKWRLLPYGTNPDQLPKKWMCSMLDWLPGMNNCSFSEEETTNALNALYQVPIPEIQNNQKSYPDGAASGVPLADIRNLNQNHLDHSFIVAPGDGKKKHGSNSTMKREAFVKSSKNVNQSSLEFSAEKRSGDARLLKMKSKREADQDGSRVSKKVKTERLHYTNEDWYPGGLSTKETKVDIQKYNEHSFPQDLEGVAKHGSIVSAWKPKKLFPKTMVMEEHDKRDISGKKRKSEDWQDSQICLEYLSCNENHFQDNRISLKEETRGSEHRQEKKARESKFQIKDHTSKGNGSPHRKGKVTRILLSSSRNNPLDGNSLYEGCKNTEKDQSLVRYHGNSSQWTVDGKNSLRRDLGLGQPSMAATSSSSKISGSIKIKVNVQEVKGSPVESVSSSPLRISNLENLRSNLLGKNDATNAVLSLRNSPSRCSEGGGDDGCPQTETVWKEKICSDIHSRSVKSTFTYQDQLTEHTTHGKVKLSTDHSSEVTNTKPPEEMRATNSYNDMERVNNKHCCFDESVPPKSGKGSSSQSKERRLTSKSGSDRGRVKISGLYNEQEEAGSLKCEVQKESHYSETYEEEMQDGKSRSQGNHGLKSDKVEKNCVGKNVPTGKHPSGSSSRENQSKFKGQKGPYRKSTAQNCQKDKRPSAPQNLQQNGENNRSSKWLPSDRTNQLEVASGRGESQIISCFGDKERTLSWCSHPVSKSEGGGGSDALPVDASDGGDAANASKQLGKVDGQNGHHHVIVRHPTPNWHGARDIEAPIPIKREFSTLAANNALREAKDLKNSANCLKISGSGLESTELFFQAALKFLHGASLLEPCNSETARYGELPSMEVYSSTAKLCEYCAHEYERCKDMASATLAYKCMEVAYMRLIYSNDLIASRDRHELQMALQMVPPVESPSSSASDVDNLNNQATVSEMDMVKDVSSPQVTGIHVISARNRPNFLRLLNFAQAVNLAMEAFRKSQDAFAAACVILAGGGNEEGISSIKRVLDFSFHDLEGLLHLVRLAMESLGN